MTFTLDGTEVTLSKDDVLTEATQKPGFSAQTEGEVTVVVDCNLTPELIAEGYQREMVSKLQNMRKDAGFEVSDRIEVTYEAGDELACRHRGRARFHHAKRAGDLLCPRRRARGRRFAGMGPQRQKGRSERAQGVSDSTGAE